MQDEFTPTQRKEECMYKFKIESLNGMSCFHTTEMPLRNLILPLKQKPMLEAEH